MPTFTPPTVTDVPQVDVYQPDIERNPNGNRLMRHFQRRTRGLNVYKMSDGTYQRSDVSVPWPEIDRTAGSGTTGMPNDALAISWYRSVPTTTALPTPRVVRVYHGGHAHVIDATEAAALTAAGYGAFIV